MATAPAQNAKSSSNTAAIIYLVVCVAVAVVAAIIIALVAVVVRTKGQLKECFFVAFPSGTFPTAQSEMDTVLDSLKCEYASYGQLMAAYEDGAQWCQAGFFDLEAGLVSGVGWPNQIANAEPTCGATGINYIAVPVISPPAGGPKAPDLAQFSGKATGFIAYGLKPSVNNVNPPGSILPFAPGGRWSQYDAPEPV